MIFFSKKLCKIVNIGFIILFLPKDGGWMPPAFVASPAIQSLAADMDYMDTYRLSLPPNCCRRAVHNAMASNIARKGRVLQGEQERDPASLHYAATSQTVRRYTTPWQAILRGKVAFCKANKRGSIPLYVTERFAAARREISRKIVRLI